MNPFIWFGEKEFRNFNFFEGLFWELLALAFLAAAVRAGPGRRRPCLAASFTFFVFGWTDFIEIHTGAWWTPWWLLLTKALCLASFAGLFYYYEMTIKGAPVPPPP